MRRGKLRKDVLCIVLLDGGTSLQEQAAVVPEVRVWLEECGKGAGITGIPRGIQSGSTLLQCLFFWGIIPPLCGIPLAKAVSAGGLR